MNHDATHCADYNRKSCPKTCYRAQLTKELREIVYPLPVSWANFRGTKECPLSGTAANTETVTRRIDFAAVKIGTPCLICGEGVPISEPYEAPKVCDKCKAAVLKVRKKMEESDVKTD